MSEAPSTVVMVVARAFRNAPRQADARGVTPMSDEDLPCRRGDAQPHGRGRRRAGGRRARQRPAARSTATCASGSRPARAGSAIGDRPARRCAGARCTTSSRCRCTARSCAHYEAVLARRDPPLRRHLRRGLPQHRRADPGRRRHDRRRAGAGLRRRRGAARRARGARASSRAASPSRPPSPGSGELALRRVPLEELMDAACRAVADGLEVELVPRARARSARRA